MTRLTEGIISQQFKDYLIDILIPTIEPELTLFKDEDKRLTVQSVGRHEPLFFAKKGSIPLT